MLSFFDFKDYVKEDLEKELPSDVTITFQEVMKPNNLKVTGMVVNQPGSNVAQTIYLDSYYNAYVNGTSLEEIMPDIQKNVETGIESRSQYTDVGKMFSCFDEIKDKIIMTAINTRKNETLLSQIPHTEKEDLSLIYRVMIGNAPGELASITIRNEHMQLWDGVTKDDLHELAVENTKKLCPITVQSMNDVMREMFTNDGMPEEIAEIMLQDMPLDQQMFIISNKAKINGAVSMFYEEALSGLADKVGTDLYILPSSVHEVIAISTKMGDPKKLSEMVKDVNGEIVDEIEQLSDNVYKFDAKNKTLSIATNAAPERGLESKEQKPDASLERSAGQDQPQRKRHKSR